ncbi:MAG: amidase family protein, partial [Chloroflexi bacterium]|nr:amidase family protein [Chloroflexota bacterium]
VAGPVAAAIDVLKSLGATVKEVKLPYVEHVRRLYTAVVNPEIATYHGEALRANPELYSDFVRERMDLGMMITGTQYLKAQQVRQAMVAGFKELFNEVDVLVGPSSPVPPGKNGERVAIIDGKEAPQRIVGAGYTNIYNLSGMPAVVLPCSFGPEGVPVGFQIAGRWFEDGTVLRVADAFQSVTDWHNRRPPYPEGLG